MLHRGRLKAMPLLMWLLYVDARRGCGDMCWCNDEMSRRSCEWHGSDEATKRVMENRSLECESEIV